jgi:hypothetical protein
VRRTRGTLSNALVDVWRLSASGRPDEARAKLLRTWSVAADVLAGEQAVYVALRLLERLAPSTDDRAAWERLPDEIAVYRAGMLEGFAWTTNREVAEALARRLSMDNLGERVPVRSGTIAKQDVLAYVTGYGEDEIIARWERVTMSDEPVSVHTVPTPVPTSGVEKPD